MTDRSAAPIRRRQCSTIPAIAEANILRPHLAGWSGILQADAFGGYGYLYATGRQPAPVLEASCWIHSRRKVVELADVEAAARKKAHGEKPNLVYPLAVEAAKRIDALFDIERAPVAGPTPRRAPRAERAAGHRARALDDRDARQALARARPDQGLQLHAAPLVILHRVPRGWADLPIQQCCRASPCAASLSAESPGCSAVPIAADSALPFSTA